MRDHSFYIKKKEEENNWSKKVKNIILIITGVEHEWLQAAAECCQVESAIKAARDITADSVLRIESRRLTRAPLGQPLRPLTSGSHKSSLNN